jgi:hypothetical protein
MDHGWNVSALRCLVVLRISNAEVIYREKTELPGYIFTVMKLSHSELMKKATTDSK